MAKKNDLSCPSGKKCIPRKTSIVGPLNISQKSPYTKLESNLTIENIDNLIIKEFQDFFQDDFNEKFLFLIAELIGILLGDGNLWHYGFRIDLNRIDEPKYVDYVFTLISTIFNKKPKSHNRKGIDGTYEGKGIRLHIYGVNIINFLVKLGLTVGHKIRNNAEVPNWVRNNRILIPFCIRGLFDTDGNIDIHTDTRSLVLRFVSASYLIANNFKDMCEKIGIKANINKQKNSDGYNKGKEGEFYSWVVSIGSKDNVKKFFEIINPKRFLFRKKLIGMRLMILEDPIKKEIVAQREQETFTEDKKLIRQTKKYETFLENIFFEYNWSNSNYMVEKFIDKALKLKSHPYNVLKTERLKSLFEQKGTIEFVLNELDNVYGYRINAHTVNKHIKKLLSNEYYTKLYNNASYNPLEVDGEDFYNKWINNNSRIIIDISKEKVVQFNQDLKIQIAFYIYKKLSGHKNNGEGFENEILYNIKDLSNESIFLGRLSYILNDDDQNQFVLEYLRIIIKIVRFYIKSPKIDELDFNYVKFKQYIANKRIYKFI